MIVDFHTHVFPPQVIGSRERFLQEDATFRLLYEGPKAKLAGIDDLLRSMDEGGIDVSVAQAFAWSDIDTVRLHNDYLLEAAAESHGRVIAFCTLPLASGHDAVEAEMQRCAVLGARGFGELRPDNLGFELSGQSGEQLANAARELDTILLFHVSEPVGHAYAGKEGLELGRFYRFVKAYPGVKVAGAHWGGGLPFFSSIPEVGAAFEQTLFVDTAASSLLYGDGVYEHGSRLIGAENILFGSDFPLLGQGSSKRRIEESGLDGASKAQILGDNAAGLLGLS